MILAFLFAKSMRTKLKSETQLLMAIYEAFFRTLIIAILLVISFLDYRHKEFPLSGIYNSVKEDFYWANSPDTILLPLYKSRVLRESDPNYFIKNPSKYPPMPYEEYRKPFLENHFWRTHVFYFELIPIFLVFVLFSTLATAQFVLTVKSG